MVHEISLQDMQHLPDWCRQFLGKNIDSTSCNFRKRSSDEDDSVEHYDIISNSNSDNDRVSEDAKNLRGKSCSWEKKDCDNNGSFQADGGTQVGNRGNATQVYLLIILCDILDRKVEGPIMLYSYLKRKF